MSASTYGTRSSSAAAVAGNGGVAAGEQGGAGVPAPNTQQPHPVPQAPQDPHHFAHPPPFYVPPPQAPVGAPAAAQHPAAPHAHPNVGEPVGGVNGIGIPVGVDLHGDLHGEAPIVADGNEGLCFGVRTNLPVAMDPPVVVEGLEGAEALQLVFDAHRENIRLNQDPLMVTNLATNPTNLVLSTSILGQTESAAISVVKSSVARSGGGAQLVLMAVLVAVTGGRMWTLADAQTRRLRYGDHDRLAHHLFALTFDSKNNAILQHAMVLGPKVSVWKVGELKNIQTAFKATQGDKIILPLEEFGSLRVMWSPMVGSVRSTLEKIAVGECPMLAPLFVDKAPVLNGKNDREMEGGRWHTSWNNAADAVTNEDVITWRATSRMCKTGFYLGLLTNKQSAGLEDVPALIARFQSLGNLSYEELAPDMTHLYGYGQSEIHRWRISSRPDVQKRFFLGKWNRYNMSLLSLADFFQESVTMDWYTSTNDLCLGLMSLDLYMVTHCGEHWLGVLTAYALQIRVNQGFKRFMPHVMCYAVHLALTISFDHLNSEVALFNWESHLTAVVAVQSRLTTGLSEIVLTEIRDTFDPKISFKAVYPSGCEPGKHVIPGSDGTRSAPLIASGSSLVAAPKIPKRRAPVDTDGNPIDEDGKADAAPKSARKNEEVQPVPSYCFASLVKGFALTSVQCKPCSDENNPVRCDKGLHVDRTALPNTKLVVKSLYNFKSKVARDILTQLKAKK